MDTRSKVKAFKQSLLFTHLGERELIEIAGLAIPCHLRKGEHAFREGDPPKYFYTVLEGRVKLYKVSHSGRNFITNIAYRGDPLNAIPLFGAKEYFLSAQAMDDATVMRVRKEDFLAFVSKYPSVSMRIISVFGQLVNSAYNRLVDLAGETVHQRICNILLMLSFKFGTTLSVKREELADLAGTTTETAIRVLSKLKNSGILHSSRGKIVILDYQKLRESSWRSYILNFKVEEDPNP